SKTMKWYDGPTLLELLESIDITSDHNTKDPRFPVQYVIRPQKKEFHDYRGYAGRVAGGNFSKGDSVVVLPSGISTKISSVDRFENYGSHAEVSESVTLQLDDDIDISRGDMIVGQHNQPKKSQEIDLMVCWFNERPLLIGAKYALRHTTSKTRAVIKSVDYKMNINTLEKEASDKNIQMNDIGKIKIKTSKPIFFDSYAANRITGSLILIDEATNETMAAGMIL
ncbi:MAG: sulfate adenylyltransferase, partial [Bacteroidales bacterium]|nr:sulfate adenylyltransferase [Bacteroidales bacterium]